MRSITFYLCFIPVLALLLLVLNLIFAPHSPYQEKSSIFECGFHSFMGQNRTQFSISFFIYALLFLLFDIELIFIYPYVVSSPANETYGFIIMIVFFFILTIGFAFELGKKALNIDTKQTKIQDFQINKLVLQHVVYVPSHLLRYQPVSLVLDIYLVGRLIQMLVDKFTENVEFMFPEFYNLAMKKPFFIFFVIFAYSVVLSLICNFVGTYTFFVTIGTKYYFFITLFFISLLYLVILFAFFLVQL